MAIGSDDDSKTGSVPPKAVNAKENQLLVQKQQQLEPVEEAEDYRCIGGRPPVEIDVQVLEGLAKIFCTIDEAAAVFNISTKTLRRRMKEEPWRGAWERGKQTARISLRRLQWRHAQGSGGSAVAMTVWMSRQHLGETDRDPRDAAPSYRERFGMDAPGQNGEVPRIRIIGGLPEVAPADLPELPSPDAPLPKPNGHDTDGLE